MPSDNELHKAANKGDLEECKKYIESPEPGDDPLDVNGAGAADRRPLHRAAGAGHLAICEYLVSKGAIVDAVSRDNFVFNFLFKKYFQTDKSGRTSLHWAAISGHAPIVKYLLQQNANILAVTTNGMSALHGACEAGKVEVVKELLSFVANDEEKKSALSALKNQDNKTACEIAVAGKQQAVVQALKEGGDPAAASAACVIS
jgi:ankyrin repeat protein